jgi:hypothetical protein
MMRAASFSGAVQLTAAGCQWWWRTDACVGSPNVAPATIVAGKTSHAITPHLARGRPDIQYSNYKARFPTWL